MLGDNVSFWLGAVLGPRAGRRLFSSERGEGRVDWARRQLERRGSVIILAARFIPGGRTATTSSAGALEMPWRRFLPIDVAAALWSSYVVMLDYFGGSAFADSLWKPLVAALLVAILVAATAELLRRLL